MITPFDHLKIKILLAKTPIVREIEITKINKRGGIKWLCASDQRKKKMRVTVEDDLRSHLNIPTSYKWF
jgi:hypothetical protein